MVGAQGAEVDPNMTVRQRVSQGIVRTAGKDMVGALGAEVDRLESEIKRVMPGIRHIDLARGPHISYTVTPSHEQHAVDCCSISACCAMRHSRAGSAAGQEGLLALVVSQQQRALV